MATELDTASGARKAKGECGWPPHAKVKDPQDGIRCCRARPARAMRSSMAEKKAHEVDAWLKRPDPAVRLVLVYGPDRGLVSERGRAFALSTGLSPDDPFAVTRLDGPEVEKQPGRLTEEVASVPMFSDKRLIWVRNIGAGTALAAEVADELAHDLTQDRYRTRVERIGREVPDDDESEEPLGWVVRTGSKDSRAEVTALQDLLQTDGYGRGTLRYTGEDGFRTSGPWVVNILEIDPAEFTGTVEPALANGIIPGLATVPATADRHGALAAVNAGFFWVFGADGVAGQITGITMVDGELVSGQERVSPNTEFVDFRSSFLLQPDGDPIADVESLGASHREEVLVDDLQHRRPAGTMRCMSISPRPWASWTPKHPRVTRP
jgi:hypothetical protein